MKTVQKTAGDKYTIIRSLGQGGEGRVYLAQDENLKRLVAVKRVQAPAPAMPYAEEQTERKSMREAGYLQRLEHPMLPVVYDLFQGDDGAWYLVMEYIEGKNLHEYIERNGAVQEEQALLWAKQLTDVLLYLHTRKPPVIYSDLKPENIMVCPDGRLRLVDFGAALTRCFGSDRNVLLAVTPGYGAPEQWKWTESQTGQGEIGAAENVDERSDIYAFGRVLYYMVTGADPARPPYTALPIYEYQPLLSDRLEAIIRRCIRPEPEGRYQTMEEVRMDLDGYGERGRRARRRTFLKVIEKKLWLTEGENGL